MASAATPAPDADLRAWPLWLCRGLAGLDAGLFGAFLAIAWLCFHSWLRGEFWWSKLNVAGAFFYGEPAFQSGVGRVTFAGAALLILMYSLLGGLLALLTPAPPRWYKSLIVGLSGAFVFQVLADHWVWRLFHPFAGAYFPRIATLPAHLLFGLSMVRLGRRYLALGRAFGGLPPPAPPPAPPAEPPPVAAEPPEAPEPPEPEPTPSSDAAPADC